MESKTLTLKDIRDYLDRTRDKPRTPKPDCWVMNKEWCYRLAVECPVRDDGFRPGPYLMTGYDLAWPIYVDETYPAPIMRNTAEYLAERKAHDGE